MSMTDISLSASSAATTPGAPGQQDFEDFFQNAPVALHSIGSDGTILRANKAELALLGYDAESYIGRNITQFHADEDVIAGILARLKNGEKLDKLPARLIAADGSIKHVLISSSAQFRHGKFVHTRCFTVDVTDWKLAEQALRDQDRRLAVTYEHATVGIAEVDAEGRRMRVNATACAITGRSREELLGGSIFDVLHSEDRDADVAQYRRLVAGEIDRYSIEKRIVRNDGSVIWASVASSAVRDAAGKFLYGVRIFEDITDSKRAADALAESEQRLAATYEHAAIAISEVDQHGRLLRVNETTCAITGYAREELLGRSIFDVTHPDDRDPDVELFRRHATAAGNRYAVEKRLIRKDGRVIWVAVASSAVRDAFDKFLYGIRVMQDITGRRQAQEDLRNSERQFRELLEALPAAVYTTDAEGQLTFYNQAAGELAGRQPQLGSDEWCRTWRLYRPDGTPLPYDQSPMALAMKENRPIRGAELIGERPDGTRVPFIPYPTPMRDVSERLVGAVNMLVDVSERKQAEANQRVLLDELNHRVKNNMQMLHAMLRAAAREAQSAEARAVLTDAGQRLGAMAAAQQVLYDAGNTVTYNTGTF